MARPNSSDFSSDPDRSDSIASQSFSEAWAKKYLQKLAEQDDVVAALNQSELAAEVAKTLTQTLRSTSAQAWTRTEALLAQEMIRHQIDDRLIDPWAVAKDAHQIYEIALNAYAQQIDPPKLSTQISAEMGEIRQKYTAQDPRVIGFISMQFHYSGQILIDLAPPKQRPLLSAYFKVIDDHLYMPLRRAYQAAAQHAYDSVPLQAVQRLVPLCSQIATQIVAQVIQQYPDYRCHTGCLNDSAVQISSIRDVEMFQVYLWVCVLENNISAVQQELFPLCVMLYPRLQVRWDLVRRLIQLMGDEIRDRLEPAQIDYFKPYHEAIWAMFSPQVFQE